MDCVLCSRQGVGTGDRIVIEQGEALTVKKFTGVCCVPGKRSDKAH